MMGMNRRFFLARAAGFLAAPAIVRASSLMPISLLPTARPPLPDYPFHEIGISVHTSSNDAASIELQVLEFQEFYRVPLQNLWTHFPEPPPAIPEGS